MYDVQVSHHTNNLQIIVPANIGSVASGIYTPKAQGHRPPPHSPRHRCASGCDLHALLNVGYASGGAHLLHVLEAAVELALERGLRLLLLQGLREERLRARERVVDLLHGDAVVGDGEKADRGGGVPEGLADGILVGVAEVDDGDGVSRRWLVAHAARCRRGSFDPTQTWLTARKILEKKRKKRRFRCFVGHIFLLEGRGEGGGRWWWCSPLRERSSSTSESPAPPSMSGDVSFFIVREAIVFCRTEKTGPRLFGN